MMKRLLIALLANLVLVGGAAATRDRLQIVSSVAMFPYTATVSERFAQTTHYPAPRVLTTGTGAGLRMMQAPENSVEVVQRLQKRRHAVGILDCVAYELFEDLLVANALDGVVPDFETISDGGYSASHALYMYVKNQHYSDIPGMLAFINESTSERAFGPDGYLIDDGLIPLNPADRLAARATAIGLNPMFR